MLTFNLALAHLGDIVMAMPAMRVGDRVICKEEHRIPSLPVAWLDAGSGGIYPDSAPGRHGTEAWLRAARRDPERMDYPVLLGDRLWAQREFGMSYTVLASAVRSEAKGWPMARWHALAEAIDGPVVMLGEGDLPSRARWAAVLKNAACVVAPDTGTVHVADALGVPKVVGLYGATTLRQSAPYWNPTRCIERPSMADITVDDVLEKLQ